MPSRVKLVRVATDLLRTGRLAGRTLDRAAIAAVAQEAVFAADGSRPPLLGGDAMTRFVQTLMDAGAVERVQKDLYVNLAVQPKVHPDELAGVLRRGAVVTLLTVLGESGAANNPSRVVTSVIPATSPGAADPRELRTPYGEFRFAAMRDDLLEAGDPADRLDPAFPYARATPERALCDWLHLSTRVRRGQMAPPPDDLDLDDLDMDRLGRVAASMGLSPALGRLLERKAVLDADEEHVGQYSAKLGF